MVSFIFINSVIEILQTYSFISVIQIALIIDIDLINIKKSRSINWINVISIIPVTIFKCFVN